MTTELTAAILGAILGFVAGVWAANLTPMCLKSWHQVRMWAELRKQTSKILERICDPDAAGLRGNININLSAWAERWIPTAAELNRLCGLECESLKYSDGPFRFSESEKDATGSAPREPGWFLEDE